MSLRPTSPPGSPSPLTRSALALALLLPWAAPALAQDAGPSPAPSSAERPAAPPGAPPASEPAGGAESGEPELPLVLQVGLGLGDELGKGAFTPVTVDVRSRDGSPHRVRVRILGGPGASSELLDLGEVEVSGQEARRLRGLAAQEFLIAAGPLLAVAENEQGQRLGAAERRVDDPSHLAVALLHRQASAPADLSPVRIVNEISGAEHRIRAPLVVSAAQLPTSPLAYTSCHGVLLGDLDVERWDAPQARALASWVARGGHLLISLGARAQALKRSQLGELLGEALGALPDRPPERDVDLQPLFEVLRRQGVEPPAGERLSAPQFASLLPGADDEIVLDDRAGRPIVIRRSHGRGDVTLIACDLWAPPFRNQPAAARVLEKALNALEGGYDPRSKLLFLELATIRQPAQVGPAFAVLICYALLAGPGVYFLLRARRRGILTWVGIPLITVAFTALVPFYRLTLRDAESTMVGVRLIEDRAASSGPALATTDVLLFSGSLDEKRLTMSGQDGVAYTMIPSRQRGGVPRLGEVLGTGVDKVEFPLPVALWGTRYVSFETNVPSPRVGGKVVLRYAIGAEGGTGRIEETQITLQNQGTYRLEQPHVVFPSLQGALVTDLDEDLPPGGEPLTISGSRAKMFGGLELEGKDHDEVMLAHVLQYFADREATVHGRASVVGLLPVDPPLLARPNVRTRSLPTVVLAELDIEYAGGIPLGVAEVERETISLSTEGGTLLREVTTVLSLPGGGWQRPERVHLRASRPPALGGQVPPLEIYLGERWVAVPRGGRDDPTSNAVWITLEASPEELGQAFEERGNARVLTVRQRFSRAEAADDNSYTSLLDLELRFAE